MLLTMKQISSACAISARRRPRPPTRASTLLTRERRISWADCRQRSKIQSWTASSWPVGLGSSERVRISANVSVSWVIRVPEMPFVALFGFHDGLVDDHALAFYMQD